MKTFGFDMLGFFFSLDYHDDITLKDCSLFCITSEIHEDAGLNLHYLEQKDLMITVGFGNTVMQRIVMLKKNNIFRSRDDNDIMTKKSRKNILCFARTGKSSKSLLRNLFR